METAGIRRGTRARAGGSWEPEAPGISFSTEPIFVERALNTAPALVILGDPGAGKSTLLKVLALALAHQAEGPLPILVPLNAYAEALERREICLRDFLIDYFATRQHNLKDLGPLFDAALEAGQAVVMLDGLDEVQVRRAFLVRLVQDFAAEYVPEPGQDLKSVPGNRLLVTSRIVGYKDAPLISRRWRTYTLVDFDRDQIERFVTQWTAAFEEAALGDTETAHQAAKRERDALLRAIFTVPGLERLASNPLLLTVLALLKRQGVTLPQRRVQLYELYLRTLINSWNKARALDHRPVGEEMDYLETVQALGPLGLRLREENPTAGLVSYTALESWLVGYYEREWGEPRGPARQRARNFLRSVRRYSNILVERGKGQYGFLHLTFEEMLAAKGIVAKAQLGLAEAVDIIEQHLLDPAWHETILLAIGALGVVSQQPIAAGKLLQQLCQLTLEDEDKGRNVVIAGEALLDVGESGVGHRAAVHVQGKLVETMQSADVSPPARHRAGELLGLLGWVPDDLDTFVEIPPGSFSYGEDQMQEEITAPYWISTYPVTNGQYARFVEDGGYQRREFWSAKGWAWLTGEYDTQDAPRLLHRWLSQRPPESRQRPFWWGDPMWNNPIAPVVGIAYFEAQAYTRWLTEKLHGRNVQVRCNGQLVTRNLESGTFTARLPTECEWARAARGTEGAQYPWRDTFETWRANTWESGIGRTTAVSAYPQGGSQAGVYDLVGNTQEWTSSRWKLDSERIVLRGGAWNEDRRFVHCASRYGSAAINFAQSLGFRALVSLTSHVPDMQY